jgi:hypothetical protein
MSYPLEIRKECLKDSILIVNNMLHILDQACGVDLGYEDYPYIYFVTPLPGYLYRTYCVD